jgi:4-hydroxyproline epimerase
MAVLHARGHLAFGREWRQESVTGSLFTGWLTRGSGNALIPHIRGSAFVTGEATLLFDDEDPFKKGISGRPERSEGVAS